MTLCDVGSQIVIAGTKGDLAAAVAACTQQGDTGYARKALHGSPFTQAA
jgi:malonyl CoA-acyl carrier protein transacylase